MINNIIWVIFVFLISCSSTTSVSDSSSSSVGNPVFTAYVYFNNTPLLGAKVYVLPYDTIITNTETSPHGITDSMGKTTIILSDTGSYRVTVISSMGTEGAVESIGLTNDSTSLNLDTDTLSTILGDDTTTLSIPGTPIWGLSSISVPSGKIPAVVAVSSENIDTLFTDMTIGSNDTVNVKDGFTTETIIHSNSYNSLDTISSISYVNGETLLTGDDKLVILDTTLNSTSKEYVGVGLKKAVVGDYSVWIECDSGLIKYERGQIVHYTSNIYPFSDDKIEGLTILENKITFCSGDSIVLFDGETWVIIPFQRSFNSTVTVARSLLDGSFLLGTLSGGVWEVSRNGLTVKQLSISSFETAGKIVDIEELNDSLLWFVNGTEAVIYDKKSQLTRENYSSSYYPFEYSRIEKSSGNRWLYEKGVLTVIKENGIVHKINTILSAPALTESGSILCSTVNGITEIKVDKR